MASELRAEAESERAVDAWAEAAAAGDLAATEETLGTPRAPEIKPCLRGSGCPLPGLSLLGARH